MSEVTTTKKNKSFASFFCRLLSINHVQQDDLGTNKISDCTTSSESSIDTKTSVETTTSTSWKDEFTKMNKGAFMTNYTLIENIQNSLVFPSIQAVDDKGHATFPIKLFSGYSQRGYSSSNPDRKNQDAMLIIQDENTNSLIFACMDGHGSYGDPISHFIKQKIEQKLVSHPSFADNIRKSITEVVAEIEKELLNDYSIDCQTSGSTLIVAVVRGKRITVANVGDSRAIIISKVPGGKFGAIPLSFDHKPELPIEKNRILAAGGRVKAIVYPDGIVGPERVWRGDVDAPGLAMSRSIGDGMAHSVGVISEPEFIERDLTSNDCALVVASDGLWNVMVDEDVVKHVMASREPASAVSVLVRESRRKWLLSGDTADDTSIITAFLQGRPCNVSTRVKVSSLANH
eukprot:gene6696-13576_t